MEFLDIIDENGHPTGETIERTEAHKKGIRHRTAHIWVIRKKNGRYQALLQKRTANKESFPGMFDTSSAGHIQAGDEPTESALRELREELGICASEEQLQFAGTFPIKYTTEFYGKTFRDNEIAFVYIYSQPVDEKRLILQKEEVDEVQWFDIDEIYENCQKHDSRFCVPVDGLKVVQRYLKEMVSANRSDTFGSKDKGEHV